MSYFFFTLQAIAWPAAASFIAWLAYRSVVEYARIVAQESKDATLTAAAARAEQALRETQQQRDEWESAIAHANQEISNVKGALLNR